MIFTSAGSSGRLGPTQSDIDAAYSGTALENQVVVGSSGIQRWTPESKTYLITLVGATGGLGSRSGVGGRGAKIEAAVTLDSSERLRILVGQDGSIDGNAEGPSGGGGTFLARETPSGTHTTVDGQTVELLAVAGGGGGYGVGTTTNQQNSAHASLIEDGKDGFGSSSFGSGGSNGYGGGLVGDRAGSGGGFSGSGGKGSLSGSGGESFLLGGRGGDGVSYPDGGFGGGGATDGSTGWGACGGAGGYSGGGGGYSGDTSEEGAGGGGGSYVSTELSNVVIEENVDGLDAHVDIYEFESSTTTGQATSVTDGSATLSGDVVIRGESSVGFWFDYGKVGTGFPNQTTIQNVTQDSSFSETVSDLDPVSDYEFRSVINSNFGVKRGNTLVFDTFSSTPIQLSWTDTTDASDQSDGFNVYRSIVNQPTFPTDYDQLADVSIESYDDLYTPNNESVHYAVTSYNSVDESAPAVVEVSIDQSTENAAILDPVPLGLFASPINAEQDEFARLDAGTLSTGSNSVSVREGIVIQLDGATPITSAAYAPVPSAGPLTASNDPGDVSLTAPDGSAVAGATSGRIEPASASLQVNDAASFSGAGVRLQPGQIGSQALIPGTVPGSVTASGSSGSVSVQQTDVGISIGTNSPMLEPGSLSTGAISVNLFGGSLALLNPGHILSSPGTINTVSGDVAASSDSGAVTANYGDIGAIPGDMAVLADSDAITASYGLLSPIIGDVAAETVSGELFASGSLLTTGSGLRILVDTAPIVTGVIIPTANSGPVSASVDSDSITVSTDPITPSPGGVAASVDSTTLALLGRITSADSIFTATTDVAQLSSSEAPTMSYGGPVAVALSGDDLVIATNPASAFARSLRGRIARATDSENSAAFLDTRNSTE